ncbi:MAG: PD40 domain-containing protein [Anaerolineae bacterium]|nr:PD40 domain-containing protein [Anaerolineae bacterium]
MMRWLAGFSLRLVGICLALTLAAVAAARVNPPGLLFTFESEVSRTIQDRRTSASDLFLMDTVRQIAINVTDHPAHDTSAAWSPDGMQMAFYSTREQGIRSLYLMTLDGQIRRAAPDAVRYGHMPAWSPDGTRIAYEVDAGTQIDLHVLHVIEPLTPGVNPWVLANAPEDDRFPAWSPDGTALAFVSWRDGSADIFRARADGSDARNLTHDPAWDTSPSWSPDGREIAFFSVRSLYRNLYLMNADGSGVRQMTDSQEIVAGTFWHAPAWSPDGKNLAIQIAVERDPEIAIVPRDGEQPVQIRRAGTSDVLPVWLAYGEQFAFMTDPDGQYGIYRADWRTGVIQLLSPSGLPASYPAMRMSR